MRINLKPGDRSLVEAVYLSHDSLLDKHEVSFCKRTEICVPLDIIHPFPLPLPATLPGEIATAPRGGRCKRLLLYVPSDNGWEVGYWDGKWLGQLGFEIRPTHWLELPAPPAESGEGGGNG